MNNPEVKHQVIEMLKTLPVYIPNSTGTQHVVRCPRCGDSRDPSHAHFSIRIDVESDTPMLYRCLKCDTSGILTDTELEELGLYVDSDLYAKIKSYNRKVYKRYKLVDNAIENFNVPLYQDNYNNRIKLDYINNRLGTDISIEEAKDLKIVLNIFDFMKLNNLNGISGLSFKQLKILNDCYVGFLSTNNNCITFRNITNNDKLMRYFKVILNLKNINSATFYSIPNSIDLLYTHDINVHITEGTFDVLSVYKNVVKNKDNNYYFANCGFGSLTILKYLIRVGINTGLNIHIYSDNDKTDWAHKNYLFKRSSISYWLDHIYIHRNGFDGEKDYGVPASKIIDKFSKFK